MRLLNRTAGRLSRHRRGPLAGFSVLLLGLLTTQSQHGYQINEFIEHNLGRVSLMKKATAYALLTRMEAAGLVQAEAARLAPAVQGHQHQQAHGCQPDIGRLHQPLCHRLDVVLADLADPAGLVACQLHLPV